MTTDQLAGATPPADASLRPRWRGVIHRWAAITFAPLFVVLAVLAPRTGDRIAVAIYGLGVMTMLTVSAAYHSGRLGPAALVRAKRIDHATILLAIAGSYTAFATVALAPGPARRLLIVVWVAAVIGAAIRMLWLHAPYPVVAVVYVVVGWCALVEWGALRSGTTGLQFALILAGGVLYSIGGAVYALHRPNPRPGVFAYHEVFHALVTAGASAHYLAMASLVLAAR